MAFAASMAIARIAGPEVFGAFAIASAMILIGNIFAEAGFSSTIIYDSIVTHSAIIYEGIVTHSAIIYEGIITKQQYFMKVL